MAAEASALDGVNQLTDAACVRTVMCSVPKINLHKIDLKADRPVPGLADLCLLVRDSLDDVVAALRGRHVDCLGPVSRTGALGAVTLVYVRDPDRNLIELSRYDQD
ncbi:hypothetical protein JNUCC75_01720 [Bifidobacterium polysaccharolyticum]